MRISLFSLAKAAAVSSILLLGLGGALSAVAQINPNPTGSVPQRSDEVTTNDPFLPLVYNVENSGAGTPAPVFPTVDRLPVIRPLPDPFLSLSNGVRDTSFAAWEQHRNEILAGFENYMVGPRPDCSDCTITASYTTTSANHYTMTVNITRNNPQNGLVTVKLTSAIVLPSGTAPSNGWPYVIGVDSTTGSMPASIFPGVATAVFTSSQVTASGSPTPTDPFYKMYAPLCSFECASLPAVTGSPYNGNSGQFAAWSWGVSRLLDGIQIISTQATNPLPLDTTHSAITGCSYAGKIALYGGALDERIALTISEEAGGGGSASWRYLYNADAENTLGTHEGSVEDIDTTDHHWWASGLMQDQFSSVNVYKLPIDLHEVAAMAAPRALVVTGNTTGYWLAGDSTYVSARAIQQVYNAFGIGDRFGFIIDGDHGHCSPPSTETAYVAQFVNRYLLGKNVSTDVEAYPDGPGQPTYLPSGNGGYSFSATSPSYPIYFPTMDYQRWFSWWGTGNPQFQNSWNTGGTTDLWFNNPLTINTGDTVEAGYDITMSAASHPAATVQLNNTNVQTDVTCSDGSSYTLYIPLAKETYTIPANDNSWYPSADQNNSATYQGSTVVTAQNIMGSTINPGCTNGQPGQASRTYLVALGSQSGTNGNPAGPGLVTTDTTQSPVIVRFHAADTSTGGGAWSTPVTVNQLPLNYKQ
jgi:hypothetical protein